MSTHEGGPPAEAPEEVVRRVFVAINAGHWHLVAESAEGASLERFRRFELALLRARMGRLPASAGDLAEVLPGAPDAVLEWFMDGETAALTRCQQWPSGFLGVENVDDLEGLPAAELFVRWLEASYAGTVPWQVPPPPVSFSVRCAT